MTVPLLIRLGRSQEEYVWACDCAKCCLHFDIEGQPKVWRRQTVKGRVPGTREYTGEAPDPEFYKHNAANGKADAKM